MIKMIHSFVMCEMNPWPSRYQLGALTTELQVTLGELAIFLGSVKTEGLITQQILAQAVISARLPEQIF